MTGKQHVVATVMLLLAQYDDVKLRFIIILGNFVDKTNN